MHLVVGTTLGITCLRLPCYPCILWVAHGTCVLHYYSWDKPGMPYRISQLGKCTHVGASEGFPYNPGPKGQWTVVIYKPASAWRSRPRGIVSNGQCQLVLEIWAEAAGFLAVSKASHRQAHFPLFGIEGNLNLNTGCVISGTVDDGKGYTHLLDSLLQIAACCVDNLIEVDGS